MRSARGRGTPAEGDEVDWIRRHVEPVGSMEVARDRPWARVLRIPVAGGVAWFKASGPVQAFEVRLTSQLAERWPDRVPHVLAHEVRRGWLLLADAGDPVRTLGNPPEAWLQALPRYAELQRGEAAHAEDHLAHGVPDLRLRRLPERYEWLLRHRLPLEPNEIARLRGFLPHLPRLCGELESAGLPDTIQHDDLHMGNLYVKGSDLRVLDWGDSCVSIPFASLVETFRFLEEFNGLAPDDPWFARLRDAYLEPWGSGLVPAFELAIRVGAFAHAIAWARQRDALPPASVAQFDRGFAIVLRRAIGRIASQGALSDRSH